MNELDGAVALVTGAGQGVGREIAIALASAGARAVVVNDVNLEKASSVADEIRSSGLEASAVTADVTDYADVARMVQETHDRHGSLDVLVNNAGNAGSGRSAIDPGNFWEIDPSNWTPYLDVNLLGPMNCSRAVLPAMVERSRGRIVTIISDAGRVGEAKLEAYSAAKAGAAGFTRALARSVGRHGITVNNVAIAATVTPATQSAFDDEALAAKMLSKYVVRRPGSPSDIAPVVVLLASNGASWITGQTYAVNGGFSFSL